MREKILLALDTAEKSYIYAKNLIPEGGIIRQPEHIMALNALYESFIHYGFAVSQIPEVMGEMDEDMALFETLIEPHLRVVDDVEMIARQYAKMYVQYIANIAAGVEGKVAVEKLFA